MGFFLGQIGSPEVGQKIAQFFLVHDDIIISPSCLGVKWRSDLQISFLRVEHLNVTDFFVYCFCPKSVWCFIRCDTKS